MEVESGLAIATAGGRTVAVLAVGYLLLFLLERALPLRRSKVRLLPRLLVNVAVSAVAFAAAAALVQPAAAAGFWLWLFVEQVSIPPMEHSLPFDDWYGDWSWPDIWSARSEHQPRP